ncbi:FAD/NAD(P)-binding domain-containing protein [Apiospora arundinis]|uniref:FAD/NAD(P)-binding domain-containing protein n=1 Tax=Apiospora arundinis TaxID=335852 RepID=A0ABR2HM12_9PEZI
MEKPYGKPAMPLNNINTVAIIGAGLSGVVTAAHLLRAGFAVTVFERGSQLGGVWVYSEQADREPPFPNTRPAPLSPLAPEGPSTSGDEFPQKEAWQTTGRVIPNVDEAARAFAPPGPTFTNMKSRGSERTMRSTLKEWPEGIKAPIYHKDVVAYIQDIANAYQVQDKIRFRTRVNAVLSQKGGDRGGWRVQTSRLITTTTEMSSYAQEEPEAAQEFDAVVVASGRYGAPRVPDIPGLALWKNRFPSRVQHTKQYRTPEPYRGKTVLLIGASVSALEVANELVCGGVAKVYLCARPSAIDSRNAVSVGDGKTTEKVAMVAEFGAFVEDELGGSALSMPLNDDCPIPAQVLLQDKRVIDGIHYVLFGTGYLASFPFLGPVLEQPLMESRDADETVIMTADGMMVHNLHEDIFYIPDPSLAFIGVTHFASEFSIHDFKAQVLAAVWAGKARLPSTAEMQEEQKRRKRQLQPSMALNGIYLLDDFVIRRLLEWVNRDLAEGGFDPIAGPDAEWWLAFRAESERGRKVMGQLQDSYLRSFGASWEVLPSLLPYTGKGTECSG